MSGRKEHWEKIYGERKPDEVSWFQSEPVKSLELIRHSGASREAAIIDVGGRASVLVDRLLELGYKDLSVLDISAAALAYAKKRLDEKARLVHWFEADITKFETGRLFDVWHDRAVFHFLTDALDRAKYVALLREAIRPGGHLILVAFAPDGPEKCSGLTVCGYDAELITAELGPEFQLMREDAEDHRTPWDKEQKFRYFLFERH
jgi:SAM-dependent methyltransferase